MSDAMEYTTLGAAGLKVSRLGLGCWAIGGHGYGRTDDAESIRVVKTALEVGVTFFDTADVYGFGHSEAILGAALGSRRHDVIIATKFGVGWNDNGSTWHDSSALQVVKALDDSLRRLRLDRIPLYQMHWHDGSTPIEATMEALVRCQESGKVGHLGCSNLPLALIKNASRVGRLESAQFRYSVLHPQAATQLLDCTHNLGVGTIAYGVLGRGLLSGTLGIGTRFDDRDTRRADAEFQLALLDSGRHMAERLRTVGQRYGRSAGQVAIRWALEDPNLRCAIIGAKTADQVRENVGAIGWRLDPEERQQLTVRGDRSPRAASSANPVSSRT